MAAKIRIVKAHERGAKPLRQIAAPKDDPGYATFHSMDGEPCITCGGDGRIGNALGGSSATCPSCHGTGRRADTSSMFRDVTKTKASHYRPAAAGPAKPSGPVTAEGTQLAAEVNASVVLAKDAKARLVAEIVNHESTHGRCTKTFIKKVRKQARGALP